MDFDQLRNKARAFLGSWKPQKAQRGRRFSVRHDRFDEDDFQYIKDGIPAINNLIRDLSMSHDYVDAFMEDFFNLLHQGDPLLEDESHMDERYRPNRSLSTAFQDTPEMEALRLNTMHDPFATAMSMISMKEALENAYKRQATMREALAQERELREQQRQAVNDLQQALAAAEAADPNDPQSQQQAQQNLQAAVDRAEAAGLALSMAETQNHINEEEIARQSLSGLRSAASQASKERQEEDALMKAFGVEDGELRRMPFEERIRLAETLRNNRLAKFSKLIGQFRAVQRAESRRKVIHSPDQVVGVELGSDLRRLTAGEMMNLAAPETEDDFWRRWASSELVQYRLEGSEKLGQGPIIVVCDESGSMDGGNFSGGTAEAWSKALALALCDQAKRGGRDFHYIGFSSPGQQWHTHFPGGKVQIAKVIEFTEHFFNGGTHYETPLTMALTIVEEAAAAGKPKPDIVFITDDYCRVPDDFVQRWHQAREALSMKCYGIVIGEASQNGAMESLCDNVRNISEVRSSAADMGDMFRTI